MIVFVAGDVGGARSLLPVARECAALSSPFALVDHGVLSFEAPKHWRRLEPGGREAARRGLLEAGASALVFASSNKDTEALEWAREARGCGIPCIHVLDNWNGYGRRLEIDGLPRLVPEVYAVMDDYAADEAEADGLPPHTIAVTGQPALAELGGMFEQGEDLRQRIRSVLGVASGRILVAFVSEPAAQNQGSNPTSPDYRGYTESDVLELFCRALQDLAGTVQVAVLVHPREDREAVRACWEANRGSLTGGLTEGVPGRQAVFAADAAAGMASILLYEAWLSGKPVLSLQPGLLMNHLDWPTRLEGVVTAFSSAGAEKSVREWAGSVQCLAPLQPRSELFQHAAAPRRVFDLTTGVMRGKSKEECRQ